MRIHSGADFPKPVAWCLNKKCFPCLFAAYNIVNSCINATVPGPCIQCCLICMGVPPKSERNQPKAYRRRRPKLRPEYQVSPSPQAELDGVFSPHGKYEDTGHDDITMLKPGVWDSTRAMSLQIKVNSWRRWISRKCRRNWRKLEIEVIMQKSRRSKLLLLKSIVRVSERASDQKQKEEEKRLKRRATKTWMWLLLCRGVEMQTMFRTEEE